MSIRWWEKTVEYEFVMIVAREKKQFLAPLDGDHERLSDLLLSSNNMWVLIEFKKDSTTIASEQKKFSRYDEAKATLSGSDSHHHIVFGQVSSSSPASLMLNARTYFSKVKSDVNEILKSGKSFPDFKQYVEKFIEFKKPPKSNESSDGRAMEDFSLVAGVNADNDTVACLSLNEFRRLFELEHEPEQKRDISNEPDSTASCDM